MRIYDYVIHDDARASVVRYADATTTDSVVVANVQFDRARRCVVIDEIDARAETTRIYTTRATTILDAGMISASILQTFDDPFHAD